MERKKTYVAPRIERIDLTDVSAVLATCGNNESQAGCSRSQVMTSGVCK